MVELPDEDGHLKIIQKEYIDFLDDDVSDNLQILFGIMIC